MKNLTIFIFSTFLSGCMIYECIDELFPRAPKPIDEEFIVELKYKERDVVKKKIVCEEYYDAMCAERGNFWAQREVGFENLSQYSVIEVQDSSLGNIIFPMPLCYKLVKKGDEIKNLPALKIDGNNFWAIKSNGNFHNYKSARTLDQPAETVILNFDLKVNGVAVDRPIPAF